jgi:phosphate transport system permease protein
MDRRRLEETFFKGLMILSSLVIFASLVLILADILIKGLPAMNWAMITQSPKGGFYMGKEGGVLNAIVGSSVLAGGATVISFLLSLPVVLYLNVYLKRNSRFGTFIRFTLDVLWGIPSIVYGAFGFTLMLLFGLQASLLAGVIAVSLLIFPIMSRAMDEVVKMVPAELLETSYSLGTTRLEASLKVVLRQALPGILTSILIAFGRGIGDAASVIFTAGFSDYISFSLFRPVATLPLAIFYQLGTPFPEVQNRAYASSLILTLIIVLISVVTRMITRRFRGYIVK